MAASADRDRHLADPESMRVHVSSLLDEGHIAALGDVVRGRLEEHTASGPGSRAHLPGDTIALVAADADGWGVSLIESLYSGFGAGILEPATGIVAPRSWRVLHARAGTPQRAGTGEATRAHADAGGRPS